MKRAAWSTLAVRLLAVAAIGAGGACNAPQFSPPGDEPVQVTPQRFPQSLNNQADILFMIDNSGSMAPKQNSLRQYFPNFVEPLKNLPQKPDLHVGIITSDMGAGLYQGIPSCRVGGDQGLLQNQPKGDTCGTAHLVDAGDRFLAYREDRATGQVTANFTGDLADAFGCYAAVGESGCGFEHQLASVWAALAGCAAPGGCAQELNAGFLRDDAYLAVILLTDEDDGSAPSDSTLWDPSANATAGPFCEYRTFEHAVTCDGVDPGRQLGLKQSCEAGTWDPDPRHQLLAPKTVADFLKSLKADPRKVFVSTISAAPTPTVNVIADPKGGSCPTVEPTCRESATWTGYPAFRLQQLIGEFDADRASFVDICQPDLKAAMQQIAHELSILLSAQCLPAALADADVATDGLQPDCVVTDMTGTQGGGQLATVVPPCAPLICDPATAPNGDCKCARHDLPAGAPGCWYLWSDAASCPAMDATRPASAQHAIASGYQLKIDRGTDAACHAPPAPADTTALVECVTCAADLAAGSYDCSPACAGNWPRCCPTDGSSAPAGCYP